MEVVGSSPGDRVASTLLAGNPFPIAGILPASKKSALTPKNVNPPASTNVFCSTPSVPQRVSTLNFFSQTILCLTKFI
jgi:hypothetical protein